MEESFPNQKECCNESHMFRAGIAYGSRSNHISALAFGEGNAKMFQDHHLRNETFSFFKYAMFSFGILYLIADGTCVYLFTLKACWALVLPREDNNLILLHLSRLLSHFRFSFFQLLCRHLPVFLTAPSHHLLQIPFFNILHQQSWECLGLRHWNLQRNGQHFLIRSFIIYTCLNVNTVIILRKRWTGNTARMKEIEKQQL